jgi:RNA polymerase sigma-70 factor (ECF subfamily)
MGGLLRRILRPGSGPAEDTPLTPEDHASSEEMDLIRSLRRGDEAAFAQLVETYHASLLRLAMSYVSSREVAEEVVQDTWLGVLQGINRFEGRSSLKTWLFRILTNRAQTRGKRESRTVAVSTIATPNEDGEVDLDRFFQDGRTVDNWVQAPSSWSDVPEERLLGEETLELIRAAIDTLPENQKRVITLRDIEQWSAEEVRNALKITETNQRVLLHRARTKVRKALEQYLEDSQR